MAKRQLVEVDALDWGGLFPWTHIFRAVRIAFSFRKILLGALAFMIFDAISSAISLSALVLQSEISIPLLPERNPVWRDSIAGPGGFLGRFTLDSFIAAAPVTGLCRLIGMLLGKPTWGMVATAVLGIIVWLLVWGIAGCALARLAAVEFAKSERTSLGGALRLALRYVFDLVYAPGLPLLAAAVLGLIAAALATLTRVPVVGPEFEVALEFITLALGLGMLIVLIGATAGWPLMVSGIAVERSDGFDGLSRAYGYIYDRPWHFAWFVIVAMVVGGVGLFVVSCGANLVVMLADGSAAWGKAVEAGPLSSGPRVGHLVLAYLLQGYAASYFWSATAIVYMLLRQSSDGVPLTEMDSGHPEVREGLQSLARERATLPIIDAPPVEPPPVEPSDAV
ncbi:MAG TPA: hypothetical protein VHB77_06720 [Planctomycetaceae bacterium]|nr:hypothetical protein [Planctomycetaceae bacterium]